MLTATSTRRGFTLVEILIALVMFSFIGAAVMTTIVGQQRISASTAAIAEARDNVRDLAALIATDLRGVSSVGGDLYAISDSAVTFRRPLGMTVVCTIDAGRLSFTIPPLRLASRSRLTSWSTEPRSGDSIFVYDPMGTDSTGDDVWRRHRLTADVSPSQTCPQSTGFTASGSEAAAGYTLTIAPALAAGITTGSAVRIFRPTTYSLYQRASGWYLGHRDCPGGLCGTVQPVLGPFLSYAAVGQSGLRFSYFDSLGVVTTIPTRVARIGVTIRAQTRRRINAAGFRNDYLQDSLALSIALRNRT